MDGSNPETSGGCPVMHGATSLGTLSNRDWWPNQLNIGILRQNSSLSNPMGKGFDYAEAFERSSISTRSSRTSTR